MGKIRIVKTKTSKKPKKSLENPSKLKIKKGMGIVKHDPLKELLNEEFIDAAILECLKNNDPQGAMEVLKSYASALSKAEIIAESKMAKTTVYHSFRSKTPTLKTFSQLLYATHQRAAQHSL